MTCIAAIQHDDNVTICGDSSVVGDNHNVTTKVGSKVFRNGEFIIGFTSSFRMGQLLEYIVKPQRQKMSQTDMQYLVVDFIEQVRNVFDEHGYMSTFVDNDGLTGEQLGGSFMFGYRGKLYQCDIDFHVYQVTDDFAAIGCGAHYAMGSLYATKKQPVKQRLMLALEAASHFSGAVRPPFNIISLK